MGLLMIRRDDLALNVSVNTMKSLGENTKWTGVSSVLWLRSETMVGEVIDLQRRPSDSEVFHQLTPSWPQFGGKIPYGIRSHK